MRGLVRALAKAPSNVPAGVHPNRGWSSLAGTGAANPRAIQNLMDVHSGREDGVIWVYACTSLIASTAASYPYKFTTLDDVDIDRPSDDLRQLVDRPNEDTTYFDFTERVFTDLELVGNSYWVLARTNAIGQPFEMRRLRPDRVQIALDQQGMIIGYVYTVNAGRVVYLAEEVAHFRYPNPRDEHYGMGTVEAILRTLDAAIAENEHITAYFQNGARLSGVLTAPETLTEDEFERFRSQFSAEYGGAANAFKILIAEGASDFKPITTEPGRNNMVDLLKYSKDQILSGFGVPQFLLGGAGEGGQYKMEEAQHIFLRAMIPRARRFQERMTMDVIYRANDQVQFVILPEASEPPSVKIEYGKGMLLAGASIDESRAVIGLEEIGTADTQAPMIPTNMIPLTILLADKAAAASAAAQQQVPAAPPQAQLPAAGETSEPAPEGEPEDGAAPPGKMLKGKVGRFAIYPTWAEELPDTKAVGDLDAETMHEFRVAHSELLTWAEPIIREEFGTFARSQRARVLRALQGFAPDKSAAGRTGRPNYKEMTGADLWDDGHENALLRDVYLPIVDQVGHRSLRLLDGALDIGLDWHLTHPYISAARDRLGEKITRVNQTTKEAVADTVDEGLRRGYSLLQIANGYPDEGYKGIVGVFDEAAGYRAEMIARSESAMIFNAAATAGYRDGGFKTVEVLDGLGDAPCAEANGSVWSLDDAESDPIAHPNCIRTFVPSTRTPE